MSDGKTKTHALKTRQGHTKHVCRISGSNSQKRRGNWYLNEFWVLCLNQPVAATYQKRGEAALGSCFGVTLS